MSQPKTFLQRWARRKTEQGTAAAALPLDTATTRPEVAGEVTPPAPTLADVTALLADADYSRFIAPDVDAGVRRAAMKKLFAEPHFNVMDGLDIYIADYNIASPVSAAMLAGFAHASTTLNPLAAWQSVTDPSPGTDLPNPPSAEREISAVGPVVAGSNVDESAYAAIGAVDVAVSGGLGADRHGTGS